jgi:hypothetical protein
VYDKVIMIKLFSGAKFKRAASVKWFKEVEMKKGAALGDAHTKTGASGFAAWFHGMCRDELDAFWCFDHIQ